MIGRPTLVVHTTAFSVPFGGKDSERDAAADLGNELYALLTRPPGDQLAWGAGIPVRIATRPDRIDGTEAEHVVVVVTLGDGAFQDPSIHKGVLDAVQRWVATPNVRVLPVLTDKVWRNLEQPVAPIAGQRYLHAPILRELYTPKDPRRKTLQEILLALARVLSGNDRYAAQLFISHAKADLSTTDQAAEKIRAYVSGETTGTTFFDKVSVIPGEELSEQLDRELGRCVFVAVRGDHFSSRAWCRRELLRAKQQRAPTLVVEVLTSGETRSATYSGNGPTIVWARTHDEAPARVATAAMVEAVRHLHFAAEGKRIAAAAGLPRSTECLSRPPELLDVTALRGRSDARLVVLHPDPPLPVFERTVLQESDKRIRPVTPSTAFSGVVGGSIKAPLDGWQLALSLSDSPDAPADSGPDGLADRHVHDATIFLARSLISVGAQIAYGGDFRTGGYTPLLAQTVVSYNETARANTSFLHGYLGVPIDPAGGKGLAYLSHSLRYQGATLPMPEPGVKIPPHRDALYYSDMRRHMAQETAARVILGGNVKPRPHTPAHKPDSKLSRPGYSGRLPGVVEEAWWTLRSDKPLYVVGGFGGAGATVVAALENDAPPDMLDDSKWDNQGADDWDALTKAWANDPDVAKMELPRTLHQLAAELRAYGRRHLSSDEAARMWNGLDRAENRLLFRTRDTLTVVALVLKGLIAVSTRKAEGKLQIELAEADVSSATGLDLLAFATFSDLGLDGAGAALDRVSGGAATRAHQSRAIEPSGSAALGADLLFAADLGKMADALQSTATSVLAAARSVAHVIRSNRLEHVGLVTFLGNVADKLSDVIDAMVGGLRGVTEAHFVWYERDPMRAALTAQVLAAHPDVVLTRRVAVIPEVPPAPGKKKTVITVRENQQALDVTLLLHRANGIAPMLRAPFSDDLRARLAGPSRAAAPGEPALTQLGSELASLLLGPRIDAVLSEVGDSELEVMHDATAGGIPYEALAWDVGGKRVTPATEGGIVRRLLVPGVNLERALVRARRSARLNVVVVIDPRGDLPGARVEGEHLVKLLSAESMDVRPIRGADATIKNVCDAIKDFKTDVLHYCGHAFYDGPGEDESGLMCADGELTLAAFRAAGVATVVPRLAFVNACQAGRLRGQVVREPQAFAEFFLRAGVDAYLGTFWLVSDDGAATFAAEVYRALARGLELGEAVVTGRCELKRQGNSDWANYVLYGHAGFRLAEAPQMLEAAPLPPQLPPSTARAEGNSIVASWTFTPAAAPVSFSAGAFVARSGEPVELDGAIRVDRREGWSGATPTVTWVATLTLAHGVGDVEIRPSAGDALTVAGPPATRATAVRSLLPARQAPLGPLRALLEQQPDGGDELLGRLMPSADPRDLRVAVDEAVDSAGKRIIWPFDKLKPPKVDTQSLQDFLTSYQLPPIPLEDVASMKFQTKEDWESYLTAPGAVAFSAGAKVLPPMWRSLATPVQTLTHDLRDGEFTKDGIELALFSDNGNGLHASRAIAKKIVESGLPYAFHLGDVYYGGAKDEFANFFEAPLAGLLDRTELFLISGNHEMFAKGEWFQDMVRDKAAKHSARQRQNGEMFRLRGPGFQILGIDTMFVGWDSHRLRVHDYADEAVLKVLRAWLDERPTDLTILLTTNEPWDQGSASVTPLYRSLATTIAGRVDLWFWGNVHYAALFEPWGFEDFGSPKRRVVGSCIGHGGYPFYTQKPVGKLPLGVHCRWLEQKSRFWPEENVRPDVGLNGWCRLKLVPVDEGWEVTLTFVDWIGRERLVAKIVRHGDASASIEKVSESCLTAVGAKLAWHDVGSVT